MNMGRPGKLYLKSSRMQHIFLPVLSKIINTRNYEVEYGYKPLRCLVNLQKELIEVPDTCSAIVIYQF